MHPGGETGAWEREFGPRRALPARGCGFGGPEYTEKVATLETGERHHGLLVALLAEVESYTTSVDRELVTRAFSFAAAAHEGQQRRSGSDFIEHPAGVARICAELRLDEQARMVRPAPRRPVRTLVGSPR